MRAPDLSVQLDSGEWALLSELYRDRPLALIFLRHLGCVFCREQISQWSDADDVNVAFVAMSTPSEAQAFKEEIHSPQRFVCDPEKELYKAFGVTTGSVGQIFNRTTFGRGMKATLAGHGKFAKPSADPMQLGATFVIQTDGEVSFESRASHAADTPSRRVVLDALRAADAKV